MVLARDIDRKIVKKIISGDVYLVRVTRVFEISGVQDIQGKITGMH